MCGIVGIIGKDAKERIIKKLKLLEYRGYDSVGLAGILQEKIQCFKSLKGVESLSSCFTQQTFDCGIGHTRWATNGKVSLANAHPHLSFDKKWAIVHNGIIENANTLKTTLKDIKLKGQTDSEIIAHLLAVGEGKSNIEKLKNVCEKLTGSFALAVINRDCNDEIYIAKRTSPLYFCIKDDGAIVASDPICFYGESDKYYTLEDGQFALLKKSGFEAYDKELNRILPKEELTENLRVEDSSVDGYFMLKEIDETPKALKRLAKFYREKEIFKKINKNLLKDIKDIKIIGCGTAYNSGLVGADYLRRVLGKDVNCYIASEFRYSYPNINKETLCIFVSQSGETADTIECLNLCKQKRAKILTITNVEHSTLAKNSEIVLPIFAGPEIAVASTKAYSCQLAVFFLFASFIKINREEKTGDFGFYLKSLKDVANEIKNIDVKRIRQLAKLIKSYKKVFFLGRGVDYFTALEAGLKMKEITYICAEAYPSGELKHGYLALVDKNSFVISFATQIELWKKTLNAVNEVKSRKGKVLLVSPFRLNKTSQSMVDYYYSLKIRKHILCQLSPIISAVFAQYLAYFVCIEKGNNPDKPRNLAKSVTVE